MSDAGDCKPPVNLRSAVVAQCETLKSDCVCYYYRPSYLLKLLNVFAVSRILGHVVLKRTS